MTEIISYDVSTGVWLYFFILKTVFTGDPKVIPTQFQLDQV